MRAAVDRRDRRPPRATSTRSRTRGCSTRRAGRSRSSCPASATQAAELAGRIGDGYWGTLPDARAARRASSRPAASGPRYAQLNVCWRRRRGRRHARPCTEMWPNGGVPRPALAGPADVDALRAGGRAASPRSEATKSVPCGPDIVDDGASTACASTSTPATTTSTSTRSGPTRTGSSTSGARSCAPRSR